ncbi:hypothetical protein FNB15_16430 [Ferrovibrio terrae]|uniref:Flagellar protein FlaG n=1 Tax=Ferrovibrio terrae TaxID=2594003 RepID=A0A516H4Q1_9PROT|nr:hypothetical protein [Ferrovibrio terrae]QDO98763.1 hypothetical protein FNB15_16430 [Ferrovibrio terrae]
MPLDILGTVAASGSSGANARNTARVNDQISAAASSRDAAVSVHSESAPREEVQVSSPSANLAVFVSPFIRFDITARLAIVEIRNSETGEVQQQYPSPRAVREYQQHLPEDSSLRPQGGHDRTVPQPRIIGSAEDRAASAPAPNPTAPAPQVVAASAAAFSSLQGVPTGSKQVAEA